MMHFDSKVTPTKITLQLLYKSCITCLNNVTESVLCHIIPQVSKSLGVDTQTHMYMCKTRFLFGIV